MKKIYYVALVGVLIVIALVLMYSRNAHEMQEDVSFDKPTEKIMGIAQGAIIPQEGDVRTNTMEREQENGHLSPGNIKDVINQEMGRLYQVIDALRLERYHSLIRKYAGWTEEQGYQRIRDIENAHEPPRPKEIQDEIDDLKTWTRVQSMTEELPPPFRTLQNSM